MARAVVHIGRLRVQFFEPGAGFGWLALDVWCNPRWAWALCLGIVTMRWARAEYHGMMREAARASRERE